MTLGERIMTLRMNLQMSQSDLAEALDVSRQSISKWETDSSTPELEKLVALCNIFGVTMDMLVRENDWTEGKEEPREESQRTMSDANRQEIVHVVRVETRKIIGILLFACSLVCMVIGSFAGDLIAGFLLGLPFIICGIICLVCKNRIGLWCAWVAYLYAEVFLRFATGVSSGFVIAFLQGHVEFGVNIIVSIAEILLIIGLAAVTVWSFRNQDIRPAMNNPIWLVAGWAAFLLIRGGLGILMKLIMAQSGAQTAYLLYIMIKDWILYSVMVLLLIWTYHWWKARKVSRS